MTLRNTIVPIPHQIPDPGCNLRQLEHVMDSQPANQRPWISLDLELFFLLKTLMFKRKIPKYQQIFRVNGFDVNDFLEENHLDQKIFFPKTPQIQQKFF